MNSEYMQRENFDRFSTAAYISDFVDILDDCWVLECDEVELAYGECKYFPDVYIAGKADGLNSKSYQLAINVWPNLLKYIKQCDSYVELLSGWELSSIWFPYQEEAMWFIEFQSEYGGDLNFCFVESNEGDEYVCVSPEKRNLRPITNVPHVIKYVVNELKKSLVNSEEFDAVLKIIKFKETIGCEVILPLISVVSECNGKKRNPFLETCSFDHLLNMLEEVKCCAF